MMSMNGTSCLGGGGFPMMMFGGLIMLVFWGLIIWLIVYLVRRFTPNQEKSEPTVDKAIDLLRQRYSRGEINTEEYRERLQELTNQS